MVDSYPRKIEPAKIHLRKSELDIVAGCTITTEFIEETLSGLGIQCKNISTDKWECIAPSYRPDLQYEVDLIEEIIRIYGYDKMPVSTRYGSLFIYSNPDPNANLAQLINGLSGIGFNQCYNNSLLSQEEAKLAGAQPVKTINPLSENLSDLRTSLIPGLLTNIDFNIKNGSKNLRLFEIGQVHYQKMQGFAGIVEETKLAGVLYGLNTQADIHNEDDSKQSFYSLKGYIDNLFKSTLNATITYTAMLNIEFEKCFQLSIEKEDIGFAGVIKSKLIKNLQLDIENDVFGFSLNVETLLTLLNKPTYYKSISKYPTISRDINLVIDESIASGDIADTIMKKRYKQLKSIKPTNIFRHVSIGENNKSIVYNFVFQDDSKTLEDKDVNPIIDEIISIVKAKFNAKLRA